MSECVHTDASNPLLKEMLITDNVPDIPRVDIAEAKSKAEDTYISRSCRHQ